MVTKASFMIVGWTMWKLTLWSYAYTPSMVQNTDTIKTNFYLKYF
jgi:hypothetical protein